MQFKSIKMGQFWLGLAPLSSTVIMQNMGADTGKAPIIHTSASKTNWGYVSMVQAIKLRFNWPEN